MRRVESIMANATRKIDSRWSKEEKDYMTQQKSQWKQSQRSNNDSPRGMKIGAFVGSRKGSNYEES